MKNQKNPQNYLTPWLYGVPTMTPEGLAEFFSKVDFENNMVTLVRLKPEYDPSQGTRIAGFLGELKNPCTFESVRAQHGGGEYQVLVAGSKTPGSRRKVILDHARFAVAGAALSLPAPAHVSENRPPVKQGPKNTGEAKQGSAPRRAKASPPAQPPAQPGEQPGEQPTPSSFFALLRAAEDLLTSDFCAYAALKDNKPEEQWDEYDHTVTPKWRALQAAVDKARGR